VTGIESDVWLTADGVPVLHHDGRLGPPGRPRELPLTRSDRLPGWLPTLAAFYRVLGWSFEFSLDVKSPPGEADRSVAAVLSAARAAGGTAATRRLWLCGGLGSLRAWRELDGDVRLVNSASARDVRTAGGIAAYARELRAAGVDALNLRARDWVAPRAAMIDVLHDQGLLAFGWDAQRVPTLTRLIRYGLDAVYSDHVDRLVAATRASAPAA
jgi:glycerophosphoryl diester phosphodiesterase